MKAALITGASSGIGREFAMQLYREGRADFFYLVARREDRLTALAAELDGRARVITADLTGVEGLDKVREVLAEDKPELEYLINASGFGKFGEWDELTEREVSNMIDLNIKALVLITNMAIPFMQRGSHIIQMGSASSFTPLPAFNVYASSKAFVLHYSKALRFELKPRGVFVACFCPIWVETEFVGCATDTEHTSSRMPKRIWPLLSCKKAVKKAIGDANKGRALSVTNWFAKLQHMMFKLLPDKILTYAWSKMLTDKKESRGE